MIKSAVIFFIIFGNIVLVSAHAQADQFQSILDCTKIMEDQKRLACFDAVSKKLVNSGVNIVKAKPTKEEKIADFGKKQLSRSPVKKVQQAQKKEEEKELKAIKLTVVDVAYTLTKKFVLFMENGQIWRQKEGKRVRLPKKKFEVEIKKGMVGGFTMTVPTKKSLIRVFRLK